MRDDVWEETFRRGLKDVEAEGSRAPMPGGARARATLRRRVLGASAVGALSVLTVGGLFLGGLGSNQAIVVPASPSPTSIESVPVPTPVPTSPSDTVTLEPYLSPSPTLPSPSSVPPPSAPDPAPSGTHAVPTLYPEGFVLPHDEEVVLDRPADADGWGISEVDELVSCGDEVVSFTKDSIDSRFIDFLAPEMRDLEGLMVFADASGAVSFMSEVRSLRGCGAPGSEPLSESGVATVVRPVEGPWGEGVVVVTSYVASADAGSPPQSGGASYFLFFRTGSGVGVVAAEGEFSYAEHPEPSPLLVSELAERATPIAQQMCVFRQAGC